MKKVELLAPARDLRSGIIAVDYGADAVYIGGPKFGARHAAGNRVEDIARLVDYARGYGVRVYAALNTLVFEEELAEAEAAARELISAGVEALIIQDMAFMRMGLEGVEFHASTQMCNTTPEGVSFLQESGFSRVILERGLTIEQINDIRRRTDIELEVFIHGAICVGFSGRCYFSRSMGPRSGNRGECGQPCRLPYDLTDETGRTLIAGKHLLSVQDMNLTGRIPQLLDAGVASFKIEGRLKEPEYIKNTVAHYRREIDRAIAGRNDCVRSSSGRTMLDFEPDPARTFTRGGSPWMIDGRKRGVASFDTPKSIGVYIGEVSSVQGGGFRLKNNAGLSSGDGICFMSEGRLAGTNINEIRDGLIIPNRPDGISAGTKIYRNYDHAFSQSLQRSRTKRVIDVAAEVAVSIREIRLRLTDSDGISVEATQAGGYEPAKEPDKMSGVFRTQIAKTGDTIFNVVSTEVSAKDGVVPFVPAGAINELRRQAADRLLAERKKINGARQRNIKTENRGFPYHSKRLGGEGNVTNSLAERFYKDHGVLEAEPGLDLRQGFAGERVMTSAYCLRRELGWCLKDDPQYKGELYLRRERYSYCLEFDCQSCRMNIIKE